MQSKAARNFLINPSNKTIKNHFEMLVLAGSLQECSTVIKNVFGNLQRTKKHCKTFDDKIHVKPGDHQGGHLIGFSIEEPKKPVKIVLALMVASLMGQPAFVARLITMFSLKNDFLLDQIIKLMKVIHDATGIVYLVMRDN